MDSAEKKRSTVAMIVTFVLLSWCSVTEGGEAVFRELGGFPGSSSAHSVPLEVSADGSVVVGYSGSGLAASEAFRWTEADGMVGLGDLTLVWEPNDVNDPNSIIWHAYYSTATDVSKDGSVVVGMGHTVLGPEAFRWMIPESGDPNDFDDPNYMIGLGKLSGGEYLSSPYGVSDDGYVIVGQSRTASGTEAFMWKMPGSNDPNDFSEPNNMISLGDLPGGSVFSTAFAVSGDGTVVVGDSRSWKGDEAFRWEESGGMAALGDLPGGTYSCHAYDISDDGKVIVGYSSSGSGWEAYRWTESEGVVGLGDLIGGGFSSRVYNVSGDGLVMVGQGTSIYGEEAAIWIGPAYGIRSLKEVLEVEYGLDLGVWVLGRASAVSADGKTIVGHGYNPNGQVTGWMVVLPNQYHVSNTDGSDDNDGLSRGTAFKTIQKAIDTAGDNDRVLVWPGVYKESINFVDKAIIVQSAADAAILEADGVSAVSFYSSAGQVSILKNFVIRSSDTGILVSTGLPTIQNITLVDNGVGIYANSGASPGVSNCIFWNNVTDMSDCNAIYSCIESGGEGEGNMDVDPLFADANGGDYHLLSARGRYVPESDKWVLDQVTSPCVDVGDPEHDPGYERVPNGGRINIGAYGGSAYASVSEWPIPGDLNRDGIVNMLDLAVLMGGWMEVVE
ncbi:MAG: hypothetical protein FVQ85_02545 [Planctomycetes bacterium]|nr:hypothetical protein [Planctomycetota bacterium]